MPEEASFNDMLAVGIDPSGFEKGLDALTQMYTSWVDGLSAKGLDSNKIINTDSTSQFASVMTQLSTQIETLQTSFVLFADSVAKQFGNAGDAAEEFGEKVSQSFKEGTAGVVDANMAEVIARFKDGQSQLLKSAADTVQQKEALRKEDADNARKAARETADAQGISNPQQIKAMEDAAVKFSEATAKQQDAILAAAAKSQRAAQQAADAEVAIQQRRDKETYDLAQKASAERAALVAKERQDIIDAAEEEAAAQTNVYNKTLRAFAQYLDEQHGLALREDAQRIRAAEEVAEAQVSVYNKTAKAFTEFINSEHDAALRMDADRIRSAEEAAAKIDRINQDSAKAFAQYTEERRQKGKPVEENGFTNPADDVIKAPRGSNPISEFVTNVPKAVAGLIAFQLEMAAANAVIEAGIAPAKLFFEAIKDGFTYQSNFQNREEDLKAVLLENVSYSKNFGENIRLAGVDAEILVRNIDDLSIKLRVNADTLKTTFQAFLGAGGRNVTATNEQALQVSGTVLSAIQSQTRNPALTNREAGTETAKLLQGTLTNNDALVRGLGTSAAKINEIVESSKTRLDLATKLEPLELGLAERLKESGSNQESLNLTLDLYRQRWDGLIAGPLFKEYISLLQQILEYFDKHAAELDDLAKKLGILIGKAAEFVKTFIYANWDGLKDVFQGLLGLSIRIAEQFALLANDVALVAQISLAISKNSDKNKEQVDAEKRLMERERSPDFKGNLEINGDAQFEADSKAIDQKYASYPNTAKILDTYVDRAQGIEKGFESAGTAVDGFFTKVNKSGINKYTGDISNSRGEEYTAKQSEPPSGPIHPINTKPTKTKTGFGLDNQELEGELEKTKAQVQAYISGQKELLDTSVEDLNTYTEHVVGVLEIEKNAVKQTTKEYIDKVNASKATPAQKATEVQRITNIGNKTIDGISEEQRQAELKVTRDVEKAKQEAITNTSNLQIQLSKNALDKMKADGADEVAIAKATTALHEQEYQAQMKALYARVATEPTEAGKTQVFGQAQQLDASHTGQADIDKLNEQAAALKIILALNQEELESLNKQDEKAKSIYDRESEQAKSYYDQVQAKLKLDNTVLDIAEKQLAVSLREQLAINSSASSTTKEKTEAQSKVDAAAQAATEANKQIQKDSPDVLKIIFDDDSITKLSDVFTQGFATGVESLTTAFKFGKGIFDDYENGLKSGRLAGGIGAVLQGGGGKLIDAASDSLGKASASGGALEGADGALGGAISGVSSMLSAAGPFISAIGPAFSLIGSLFTAAAKKTAEEMQKQFSQIQTNYQAGTTNLTQTIQQEQSTISQTIANLSGQKGGQGELDSILPGMQQALTSLIQEQKQVEVSMDQSVESLNLQNTTLQTALSTWVQMNQQVTSYINAGGSVQEAAQFISASLQQQKQQAADSIVQSEQTGVQDAENYNNLLQQRTDLIKQYNEQAFGIKNADSIERKQANAVTANSKLADATSSFQTSLQSDNQQIQQMGETVSAYQQVYGIATDTASLQAESNALNLYSLNEQVTQWKSVQAIYNGIVQTSSGQYTYTQALANLLGYTATFGNDPASTYTGTNTPVTTPVKNGASPALPLSTTGSPVMLSGITPVGGALPVFLSGNTQGYTANDIAQASSTLAGSTGLSAGASNNVTVGNVTVTITNTSGATIDANSIANDLSNAIISRNQYSASTYY